MINNTTGKNKRSVVWTLFQDTDEPNKKKCKQCLKTFIVNSASTTCLLRHAKLHDPSVTTSKDFQPIKLDKPIITQAIAKMIVKDLQPFRVTEQSGFRELLSLLAPEYTIPARTTFSRSIIPKLYEDESSKVKKFLTEELEYGIESAAFTIDGWTSRATDGYLSLTMHFFTQDMVLNSLMLNMRHFPEAHSARNISEFINFSLNEWGLSDLPGPLYFITDNAKNMVNAIVNSNENWVHIPCFAHTLQLVVNDAIKSCSTIKNILQKARSIVSYFNRSTTGAKALEKAQISIDPTKKCLKPIQDVATRWNSQFDMLSRLLELRDAIEDATREKSVKTTNLLHAEWEAVVQFLKLFEPLKIATVLMSADKYPTLSNYIPVVKTFKKMYTENDFGLGVGNSDMHALREKLIEDLDSRFDCIFENESLLLAMVLDPRFKAKFLSAGENLAVRCKLKSRCLLNFREPIKTFSVGEQATSSQNTTMSKQFLENLFGQDDDATTTSNIYTDENVNKIVAAEIEIYFSESTCGKQRDIMEWWRDHKVLFPNLWKIAKTVLHIPATQTTSERLFSTCGHIVRAERANLLTDHVEEIAFLHENM